MNTQQLQPEPPLAGTRVPDLTRLPLEPVATWQAEPPGPPILQAPLSRPPSFGSGVPPTLTIVGPGRVGRTIGRLLVDAHAVRMQDVLGRSVESAAAGAVFIGSGKPVDTFSVLRPADAFLLTVPDDQLRNCGVQLAKAGCLRPGTLVFHCSGAQSSQVLSAASVCGAILASVHPIRSFADPATVAAGFAGTWCGIEGEASAVAMVSPWFQSVGARLISIDSAKKTLYHSAAVFASNYIVTLIDVAVQAYVHAGVEAETALEVIAPLLRETAENVFRLGAAQGLTGPIARGDMQTVADHQQALMQWSPPYAALYSQLAEATLLLAARAP